MNLIRLVNCDRDMFRHVTSSLGNMYARHSEQFNLSLDDYYCGSGGRSADTIENVILLCTIMGWIELNEHVSSYYGPNMYIYRLYSTDHPNESDYMLLNIENNLIENTKKLFQTLTKKPFIFERWISAQIHVLVHPPHLKNYIHNKLWILEHPYENTVFIGEGLNPLIIHNHQH